MPTPDGPQFNGKHMGWSTDPASDTSGERMRDMRDTGAQEVRGTYGGGIGRRHVTYTLGGETATGPTARTKRGARKAMWGQING